MGSGCSPAVPPGQFRDEAIFTMIRNKSTRVLTTLGVTVSLAIGAFAGPALVSAAPAPLLIGRGPVIGTDAPSGALPGIVTPGQNVAFQVWAKNDGSSNISKLFLTGLTAGEFVSVTVTNTGTTGTCAEGPEGESELQCSWLGVVPGATIKVFVVVQTPVTNNLSMPIDFEWSTSGYVQPAKGKNKSHGDAFKQMDAVALNGDGDLFYGGYFQAPATVATNPSVTRQNPQSTAIPAFNAFTSGPLTVQEVPGSTYGCPDEVISAGGTCVGQWSLVNVNGGESFDGGFEIQIRLDGSVAGGNIQSLKFVHVLDDNTVKLITATCSDLSPDPSEMDPGCKFIEPLGGGDALIHLFVLENGRARTF
jgi:hypothetical protein